MTEICSVIQGVIQLMTPLIHEVQLIANLPDHVKSILPELDSISAFLKTAEQRAESDDTIKVWVKEVRRLAYDIEDVIEEYHIYQSKRVLHKWKDIFGMQVRRMAKTIELIQENALAINRRRLAYRGTNHQAQRSSSSTTHYSPLLTEKFELVGVATPKSEIIRLLGLEDLDSPLSLVAVVGPGGIGKTAIVESVYEDGQVRDFFPTRAWIHLAQPFDMVKILRTMLVQLQESARELRQLRDNPDANNFNQINEFMDQRTLQSRIKHFLDDKRFMIVFDNVQEAAKELVTHIMKKVLPSTKLAYKGSRVMVMTTYENVARAVLQGTHNAPYKLKPLPENKAWELFCKKTFENGGGTCPSNLRDLAHRFVERCQGLPSLILGIGGVLSEKQNDMLKWQRVYENLDIYLKQSSHFVEIQRKSNLKYAALPFHLKPCLLYFGMFPRDWGMSPKKIVRLWVAEGFVTEAEGCTLSLEETAEEYLKQLIDEGLVLVKSRDNAGNPKTLGVFDDFLWEIILSRLEELSFCQVVSAKRTSKIVPDNPPRRLSIHGDRLMSDEDEVLRSMTRAKSSIRCLISLVYNHPPSPVTKPVSVTFLANLHLLKVLELCDPRIQALPEALGDLLNLRYLNLSHTRLQVLPKSIGNLQNLQTLELKHTQIHVLPIEINSLPRLRHLLAYSYEYDPWFSIRVFKTRAVKIPKLWNLSELQKLAFLDVSGATTVVHELRNLTQLRRLGITGLRSEDETDLSYAIQEMKCLESLSIYAGSTMIPMELEGIICPQLKRLYLNGGLTTFPSWIFDLHNLVKIRLRWSRLHVDPLEILQNFHNLVELQLLEAYEGISLQVRNGGFKKLKILELLDLHNLNSLQISSGALPLLEKMSIGESPRLKVLNGMQNVTSLRELNFYNMPAHFTDAFQLYKPFYANFGQVPEISFYVKGPGGWELDTSRS